MQLYTPVSFVVPGNTVCMIEFCGCVCSRLYGWAAESIVNAVRLCGESGDEPCAYYYTRQHGSLVLRSSS